MSPLRRVGSDDHGDNVEENKVDLTIKDPNLFDEMEGDPDTEFEFISMDDYLDVM